MDRAYREETFAGIHARARKGALLPELEREYSLYDIAVITRAGPARALGLETKGHLGVGADADIAIYAEQDDKEAMFAKPRYVFKDGVLVARDGVLVAEVPGRTFYVAPPYDPAIEDEIRAYFERAYTVAYENYAVLAGDVAGAEPVACG